MTSSNKAAAHHAPDVKMYFIIFGALLVLTAATVLVSYLELPKMLGITIGLMIATVKASLVAAFFMHLKGERTLIYGFLGLTVFFMAVLFLLPITDAVETEKNRQPMAVGSVLPQAAGEAHHEEAATPAAHEAPAETKKPAKSKKPAGAKKSAH
ncbi:MAG: cytochrome C oxidase subunit IV family protein [Elusimicrobia bacterium]|nr:cytochrome C oxidase subunit IV family protein [Elusimicrobiota bacterium]